MTEITIIFPHQLFEDSPLLVYDAPVYLMEEYLFFRQYPVHKQKVAFHRASMKQYEVYLKGRGKRVHYIDSQDDRSDIRTCIDVLHRRGVAAINYIDPTDNWLEKRLRHAAQERGIAVRRHENPSFLRTRDENRGFFNPAKKRFFQTRFYMAERKRRRILVDARLKPLGGSWTYDRENRKRYPAGKVPPPVQYPPVTPFHIEAVEYVHRHFAANPGAIPDHPLYPTAFDSAREWLCQFLTDRLREFGPYEDAIVSREGILNHSVLSPLMNAGLLTPRFVLEAALNHAKGHDIPLASTEGFVRQILGWREFIRGIYECRGSEERTRNYWGFTRKIPPSFYSGTTGMPPVDITIRKVLQTGYCHHIERLMVLGNFMVLCEFDPDDVYRWFMEFFIDAYDWVMVPNVYGMSQFADGGVMATKPYISGSNYLMKMADYTKGEWQHLWDALFWRFMDSHRAFFLQNPRLGMLVRTFDAFSQDRRMKLIDTATTYLARM